MQTHMLMRFLSCTAIAGLLSLAAPATAQIISSPASLVNHGTYITDTAHNLDWFKFAPTLGLSFDAAVAANASGGWQGATLGQVHGLWSVFGYVSDTPSNSGGFNANAGLTDALASYLGYTYPGNWPNGCCGDRRNLAYTAELESPGNHWATLTQIDVITNNLNDQVISQLDVIASGFGTANPNVGTWLVRDAVSPIPEPETYAMLLAGLGVLAFTARRRKLKLAAA